MKFLVLTYGVSPNGFVGVRRVLPCEGKQVLGLGELQYIDTILRLYLILIDFDRPCVSSVGVRVFPSFATNSRAQCVYFHNFVYKISDLFLSSFLLQPLSVTP